MTNCGQCGTVVKIPADAPINQTMVYHCPGCNKQYILLVSFQEMIE